VGWLDKAKQLAEQAREKAEGALAEVRARTPSGDTPARAPAPAQVAADPRMGTPYVPGMLGRPAWRERGLVDPAAVLPITDRDRAGVPHDTRSQVLEEPFGMGRRWSSGGRSAALFYQLYPEHRAWEPPGGRVPLAEVPGASAAALPDGRSLVFLGDDERRVVLEVAGLDEPARTSLVRAVAAQLEAG
jgi:hypothetical protein